MDTKFICAHCKREVNGCEDRLDGHLILEQNYHCPHCGYGYEFSYGAERIYPPTHSFSGVVLLIAHSLHIDKFVEWLEYKLTGIWLRKNKIVSGFKDSNTCVGCVHLTYNSDGSTDCAEEYYHRCSPKTRIKYKRKTQ